MSPSVISRTTSRGSSSGGTSSNQRPSLESRTSQQQSVLKSRRRREKEATRLIVDTRTEEGEVVRCEFAFGSLLYAKEPLDLVEILEPFARGDKEKDRKRKQ